MPLNTQFRKKTKTKRNKVRRGMHCWLILFCGHDYSAFRFSSIIDFYAHHARHYALCPGLVSFILWSSMLDRPLYRLFTLLFR